MSGDDREAASSERREAVEALLAGADSLADGETVLEVEQLSGGWSRHSFLVSTNARRLMVRSKPPGGLLETDLESEHQLYVALAATEVPVPRALASDFSPETPFDGPYFVMDHVPGSAPNVFRRRDREALLADWKGPRRTAPEVVEALARIHAVDPSDESFSRLPTCPYPELVGIWREVCERTRLVRDPVVEGALAWLETRDPPAVAERLVHGDFRAGNLLVEEGRVTAVLDWELAHRGDPRFDLGYFSLEYTAGRHLGPVTELLGSVAEEEWFLAEYERLTGAAVDREVVRTFAVLAAILLVGTLYTGIEAYAEGRTADIRMAWNRFELPSLRRELCKLMEW